MIPITYLTGDATRPQGKGPKILAHIVNDIGAWGSGFAAALSSRWGLPVEHYRELGKSGYILGKVQFVPLHMKNTDEIVVANMIAQRGVRGPGNPKPICYHSLFDCLKKVCCEAEKLQASVHMPRIGTGLAGGDWTRIESKIIKTLCDHEISVFVYDLEKQQ